MGKRGMIDGALASAEYSEALGRLGRFERIISSGRAELILEGAQSLERYFEILRGSNPDVYSATDGERRRVAERVIAKFAQFMAGAD